MLKIKLLALLLSLIFVFSPAVIFAVDKNSQDIKISQKLSRKKFVQIIRIIQRGDGNQGIANAVFSGLLPDNLSPNFKIIQKIKIKQKGDNNQAIANAVIDAAVLGLQNVRVIQKGNIKQKGSGNQAVANPVVSLFFK